MVRISTILGIVCCITLAGGLASAEANSSAANAADSNDSPYVCNGRYNDNAAGTDTASFASKAKSILQIENAKSCRTDAQKKLSTDLLQLLNSSLCPSGQKQETLESQMQRLKQFRKAGDGRAADDMVYVYVYLKPPAGIRVIEPYVWELAGRDETNHLAVAWVEVNDLETLASLDEVRAIRTVMPPILRAGSVITEGDAIHRTSDVRTTYSQSGSGVKVGIISDGVDNLATAQSSGDLPAGLTVLSNTQGDDEGTAMLEIVHDMVPDADLYFHDSGANVIAFNAAIDALVNAGCDVICDDIGWPYEPFFEDGIIASHVADVIASNNIIYVSSAGNDGENHYQGDYYDDGDDFHDFSRGTAPEYKYLYVDIPPNGEVTVILQWNDKFGSSGNDYDLYLRDNDSGYILDCSDNTQDGDDDPLESIDYTNAEGYTIDAVIGVQNYNSEAETRTLEVFISPRNGASVHPYNIDPVDSIFGHPAVPDVIAVGAINASDPGNDDIEEFSCQGPVTIIGESERAKPDLCGIDGVAVTGAGGFSTPFYGTSAAAPHVAAIAAQLWGAFPDMTGDEIRTVLYDSAVDLGSAGRDNIYGYGRTDALAGYASTCADWTFMVYMDGDCNLEASAIDDMNEMEMVGSTDEVNIITLLDRISGEDDSNGNWTATKLFEVTEDSISDRTIRSTGEDWGELNMGDPNTLADFAVYGIENYPAEHYALIIWDHGGGWKSVANDETDEDEITMPELNQSLFWIINDTGIEKLDIIGFDTCLMGQLEVADTVAPYADIMVGAEECEDGGGWNYTPFLNTLADHPDSTPEELAINITTSFSEHYTDIKVDPIHTLSVIDLDKIPDLVSVVDDWAVAMIANMPDEWGVIGESRYVVESYPQGDGYFVDLYDLAELVWNATENASTENAAEDVMAALGAAVIDSVNGPGHPHSNGLTIYLPEKTIEDGYTDVNFASETYWDEYLSAYYNATESDTTAPVVDEIEDDYEEEIPVLNPGDTITINTTITGDHIVDVSFVLLRIEDESVVIMDFDEIVDEYGDPIEWIDGENPIEFEWDATSTIVANGTVWDYIPMHPIERGSTLYVAEGIYIPADSTDEYNASVIFDSETGELESVHIELYNGTPSRGFDPDVGDSFAFYQYEITEDDLEIYLTDPLVFDGEFVTDSEPLPNGNYAIGFIVEDISGNIDEQYIEVVVESAVDGDLNNDGDVTTADAAIALQLAVSGGWDQDADVSDDGQVTSLDALMILQIAAESV